MLHYTTYSQQAFFMAILHYKINSRELNAYTDLSSELTYQDQKNYLFDLDYLTGIHVIGEHAQDFLQGQLTCDLREIHEQQMRKGALCDLKGRIIALLDVINWNGHGFQLILPRDLLTGTRASLIKTAMFSRVTLAHATHYQLFGFHLQNENDAVPFHLKLSNTIGAVTSNEDYCCYYLGNHFYILMVENSKALMLRDQFKTGSQFRGSLSWHMLQLQNKRIEIYPESRGLFLPHRLGLQLSGYLSFDKGCYKGQEIIARTHYRAKLKHELKMFKIHTKEILVSGKKILEEEGKVEIGELVDFCPIGDGVYLIAASMLFEHAPRIRIEGHQDILHLDLLQEQSS